jgi:hypothetical protein
MTANPAQRHDIEALRPLSVPFPPQVVSLVQTCECHPSQWEGWTSDGHAIYVRFRYGRLWIGLAPDYRRTAPTMLFVTRYPGDGGDEGYLCYETLQRLTDGVVDWR